MNIHPSGAFTAELYLVLESYGRSRAVTMKRRMNERQVGEITELEALEINVALFLGLDLMSFFDLLSPLKI